MLKISMTLKSLRRWIVTAKPRFGPSYGRYETDWAARSAEIGASGYSAFGNLR